jgi:hypothetical protein
MEFMERTAKYPIKRFYQNLKRTQLLRKFKITEINVYNIFSEWTMTDCHTE